MAQLARKATFEDWPGIELVRDVCYERWGMEVQERDFLQWYVSDHDGRIVAAVGYCDQDRQRHIYDWYAYNDRYGKRGTSAILAMLLADSDADGMTIIGCSVMPEFIQHAFSRGFKFLGVAMYRKPGGS